MQLKEIERLIRESSPGFESFGQRQRFRYAEMVQRFLLHRQRRHKTAPDAVSFHYEELENWFGRGGFADINAAGDCMMRSDTWDHGNHVTRCYWLTGKGKDILEAVLLEAAESLENEFVTADGGAVRSRTNGIASRDALENLAKCNARIRWAIPVNTAAIAKALKDLNHRTSVFAAYNDVELDYRKGQLLWMKACANRKRQTKGFIPQVYVEVESGRLYGSFAISLQTVCADVRRIALSDSWEYDFQACHHRILAHIAQGYGMDSPGLARYIKDKQEIREQLAEDLNVPMDRVKRALIGLIYGAQTTPGLINHRMALAQILGEDIAPRFVSHSLVAPMIAETKEAFRAILEKTERHKGGIVNSMGKICIGDKKRQVAHVIQGWEALMINLVLANFEFEAGMLVLQHDGWGCESRIEPSRIEDLIFQETGFWMPLEVERVKYPKIH